MSVVMAQCGQNSRSGMPVAKQLHTDEAAIVERTGQKEILTGPALELYQELSKYFMCDYDETGSIGKRYRRQDEIGTPYCITVDFDTQETGIVTVRDRDTMEQVRIPIAELKAYIAKKCEF